MAHGFLKSAKRQFHYYKQLGEKTIEQLRDEHFGYRPNNESNSIINIVKHLRGNMLSRWTDFLTSDGEKPWRDRDDEFDPDSNGGSAMDRKKLLSIWNEGWDCLFATLDQLSDEDLNKQILIRGESHSVLEAINRQLAHYSYHVGQIVYLGKILLDDQFKSLSIPRNQSKQFNQQMMDKKKD